jgi:hypothetical protein
VCVSCDENACAWIGRSRVCLDSFCLCVDLLIVNTFYLRMYVCVYWVRARLCLCRCVYVCAGAVRYAATWKALDEYRKTGKPLKAARKPLPAVAAMFMDTWVRIHPAPWGVLDSAADGFLPLSHTNITHTFTHSLSLSLCLAQSPELKEEVTVVRVYVATQRAQADAAAAQEAARAEAEAAGALIECQCCFDTFPFEGMVQCAQGDLFCASCLSRSASPLLSFPTLQTQRERHIRTLPLSNSNSPLYVSRGRDVVLPTCTRGHVVVSPMPHVSAM